MDKRRDALLAAAKYVQMVNRVVTSEPGPFGSICPDGLGWPGAAATS